MNGGQKSAEDDDDGGGAPSGLSCRNENFYQMPKTEINFFVHLTFLPTIMSAIWGES